jgi:hypothetical protein
VLALVATAPAWLVDHAVREATGGMLRVDQASGTLWQGRGDLASAEGKIAPRLQWSLQGAAALSGRVRGSVWQEGVSEAAAPSAFEASPSSQSVEQLRLRLNAGALSSLPVRLPARLKGILEVRADSFRKDIDGFKGKVSLVLHEGTVEAAGVPSTVSVGDATADCEGLGAQLVCQLANGGGDVAFKGEARWNTAGAWSLNGELRPSEGLPPSIAGLLRQLPRSPNGSILIKLGGQ